MRKALGNALRGRQEVVGLDPFVLPLHAHAGLFERGDTSVYAGHFDESMETIAAQPAPPGKVRAGVLFSAHAVTLKADGDGAVSPERHGKHEVVLSVHVPGAAPYAVHVPKFDHKDNKAGTYMAALPALVSAADRNQVEVQWDEIMSTRQARKQGRQMAAARRDEVRERVDAIKQAAQGSAQPGSGGFYSPAEAYKRGARASLARVTDPAQRQSIIERYRGLGVRISDDGEVED
jgi:hypothetical protein